jgi:hypothetical protein
MSMKVSTFLNVGGYRYTFLLVVWNDYADAVRDELNRQAEAFGADLGSKGLFAQPFPDRKYETAEEVLAKQWPEDLEQRLSDTPDSVILVLDQPFSEFDPREHGYAVIWLGDYHNEPTAIRPLLQMLARKTKREEDVIAYLKEIAERAQKDERREGAAGALGTAARIASYVEVKPSLFGVSIDLKAILQDLAARR